jgi:hypothetical protein
MTRDATMRLWTRAIFAGVLAVALLLPTIDLCICAEDVAGSVQAAATVMADAAPDAAAPCQSEDGNSAACQYCHCFHLAGMARIERVTLDAAMIHAAPAWTSQDSLYPPPAFSLLRPPRA